MDVRERLRSLATDRPTATGGSPGTDDETERLDRGIAVFGRARRRRTRRRVGGSAAGLLAAVLVVAVAWPGALPGGLVIDEVADTPDDAVPTLDLPDGWQQVRVGGAVLGIPPPWVVRELGPEDPYPCGNESATAFLVHGGWTLGNERALQHPYVCWPGGTPQDDPVMLAAAFDDLPGRYPEDGWEPTVVAGTGAEMHVHDPGRAGDEERGEPVDDVVADRVARYRVPELDLYLEFTSRDEDLDLIEQVLDTITPVGPGAPPPPVGPDGSTYDLPDGWRPLGVAGAVLGVPPDASVEVPGHDGRAPCPHDASMPTVLHVLDAYPLRGPLDDESRCGAVPGEPSTVTAARLSLVPDTAVGPIEAGAGDWEPIAVGDGIAGEVRFGADPADDDTSAARYYRFPSLDLWLYAAGDRATESAVLATLARAGARAPAETTRDAPGFRVIGTVSGERDGTSFWLDAGTCGDSLAVWVDETPEEVRLTVAGTGGNLRDCADQVGFELEEPLGDRRFVDTTTGTVEPITGP